MCCYHAFHLPFCALIFFFFPFFFFFFTLSYPSGLNLIFYSLALTCILLCCALNFFSRALLLCHYPTLRLPCCALFFLDTYPTLLRSKFFFSRALTLLS